MSDRESLLHDALMDSILDLCALCGEPIHPDEDYETTSDGVFHARCWDVKDDEGGEE